MSQECEKCLLQGKCNICLLEAITFGGYPTLECMYEGEGCDKCITACELEHDVSFFVHTGIQIYNIVNQFLLLYSFFQFSIYKKLCYFLYSIMVKPHQASDF